MSALRCPVCAQQYPEGTPFCPRDGSRFGGKAVSVVIQPGFQVGQYVIEGPLGSGGMGEVWSARHPSIGKRVAIKFLHQEKVQNATMAARFLQEARAVNEIQHPNIVDVFSFDELPDGRPYLIMEILQGQPLSALLQERGVLPLSMLLPIFSQVCSALKACHARGIVHRDLKPENLFLVRGVKQDTSLFIKVLDFGIAKLDLPNGERLTNTGVILGTPAYMAPEACKGSKTVDHRADIYSLGVILYELLAGRTPFHEPEGAAVILARHMFMPTPAPSTMSTRPISPELDAVVLRALAKNPEERYQSCQEFYQALEAAVNTPVDDTAVTAPRISLKRVAPSEAELAKAVAESLAPREEPIAPAQTPTPIPARARWPLLALPALLALLSLWLLFGDVPRVDPLVRPASASSSPSVSAPPSSPVRAPSTAPVSLPASAPSTLPQSAPTKLDKRPDRRGPKILFND